ncbi:MAG: hypothetical protein K5985_12150, partial [Lachnospiraceae bacterium]|nr:hypothetical protein [Lachnospiraceae bacterium]
MKKFVWDKDGKRLPDTAFNYEYGLDANTDRRGSTKTDKDGVAVFDFNQGVFKSSADYQQNAYMYLKYNFGGKEEKLKLHIAVDPYSYTETYTGDITAKAKGGYGTGVGDEDLGASLSGKLLVGDEEQIKSDVNFSVVGSKKSLDLTNSNYSRGSIEANITPEVKGKMFNVSLGNPAADTSAYYTRSYGMQAGDLDNMSLLELDEIARFFGNTIRETKKDILLNHTILGFLNPINFYEYDTHSRGYGFDAGAGLDPFKLTVNTGDSGKAEGTILPVKEEMSFQYKEKNNKDGSKTYESSASSYAGVKMADITLSDEIGYEDEWLSVTYTTNSKNIELWPMGPRHDITYSADMEGGKLVSLGITSPENDPPKLFRDRFTETREMSAELSGKNAEYMTGKIGQLDNLSKGVPLPVFSEISDTVFSTLGNPMLEKKFTRSKSRSRAETLSLGFSPEIKSGSAYKPVIDLGVDYECKLTQSFDWDVVRIVDIDGLETASVEIKSVVDYPKTTLYESLVQKALSRLEQVVEEKLGFESGTLADIYTSIRSGNATLQLTRNPTPAVIDYVYYLINVLNGNENPAGAVSYAIETRTEEAAGGEPAQTVQAVTIGTPVVLKIEDASGNDVENNPTDLKLTMTYTQEDLAAANLRFAEDNDIRIYRYVSEDCVYEPVKSTCDPGERRVVAETSKAGEYVMAVDRDAPVISGVSVYDSTETPFIGAYISDFLGISSVVLKIDGTEYLNKDTYAQYMNGTDLFWQVPEDRKLSTGEHELLITASDSTGKTSEASANFIVLPPVAATGISMNTAKLTVSVG